MTREELKKLESLINREEQVKQTQIHSFPLLENWGIFAEEIVKPLIVSVLRSGKLYEHLLNRANTAITPQIETLLNWLLDYGVLIPQSAQVRNYLIRYFDLTRILRSICKVAVDRFGMQAQLSLEVYCDPEIVDEYLTLYIRQSHYNEDILKSIEELRAEYEVDLTDSSGWFLITTDFRPPL